MKFSIVIPLAPERKAEILESLKNLNYPKKDFEIIIEKGKNPSENRNKGARKAKGEIIAFLDDDAKLDRDFLKRVENFFSKYNVDVVGGPQLTPEDDKTFARISAYGLASIFGGFSIRNRYKKGKLNLNADEKSITSANLFCKKKVIEEIKFNPDLFPGEDPDFINQCKKRNFRVAYTPEIFIHHRRRANINEFIKQIFNYGKTRPKIEAGKLNVFFLIPSFFLVYIISWLLLSFFIIRGRFSLLFGFPLFLYIILNLLFSFGIAIKEKSLLALFFLPFIFLILHISYGIGIINGLFRKK